jgi:hypothetical protein
MALLYCNKNKAQPPFIMQLPDPPKINIGYIADLIVAFSDDVEDLKNKSMTIMEIISSIEGIYIILLTGFGCFLVTIGTRFRKVSLGILSLFVIYAVLRANEAYADNAATPINNFLFSFEIVKNSKIFGEEKNLVLGYIILSLLVLSVISAFVSWIKIFGAIILAVFVYLVYKTHIKTDDTGFEPVDFALVGAGTLLLIFLFAWIEDLLICFIICFFGFSVIIGFTAGYFDFPEGFTEFYAMLFEKEHAKDAVITKNFMFLIVPTLLCTVIQRKMFKN